MVLPPAKALSPQSSNFDTSHSMSADDEEWCIPESAHKKTKATLVNNSAPPQGSNMERPMGMKKAKLIKKLEDAGVLSSVAPGLLTDSFDTRNAEEEKMMADMSSATRELVSVLKATTSTKQDELRMRTHEKWMKMASIYATCGQHDLALATMKKIEDDEDQLAASKANELNHDPRKGPTKEAAEEKISDQHGKDGNGRDYEGEDKWCDAIETGEAAVESGETATDSTIQFSESAAGVVPAQSLLALCIECKQTPSTHKCRRCKQFVCDPCCYEKRGLELIWWCATCFDDESLTNQQQIREGKYESDNESAGDIEQ
ncbi:hypothetical protein MHU86_9378 [Fragilaria crotonensis]|nr:hypothetical protein MHU86_9378 [Fragilaria crotonensis]